MFARWAAWPGILATTVAVLTGLVIDAPWKKGGDRSSRSASTVIRRGDIARVVRLRRDAVVSLHTTRGARSERDSPESSTDRSGEGLGSGFVIERGSLVVTNAHVIEDIDGVHVRTHDGQDVAASVVGFDAEHDLALLRAPGIASPPAPFGNSDAVEVGDWVIAIGNPFGLHHTVTAGIVSARARTIDPSATEYLQVDAAINPGNSGGPVLDLDGNVIGIATAILSETGGNVGLNFVIPINVVKGALPALRTGRITQGTRNTPGSRFPWRSTPRPRRD